MWKHIGSITVLLAVISGANQHRGRDKVSSPNIVMAFFSPMVRTPGPCRYLPATRKQNHQCRKDVGLPEVLRDAHRLALTHCEEQFRYDRWNCSLETRGKRNIFKKVYRETAFVHAITAAALTFSVARACSEGRLSKCSCGGGGGGSGRKQVSPQTAWKWGGCNDNLKHGKRVTRKFLELEPIEGDQVVEMLRHDSEVGIQAVTTSVKDKCKCHGVSGSCSMKTCWKKLSDFNTTSGLLRLKYHQAIRQAPSNRSSRKVTLPRRRKNSPYTDLYYMATSPTFCSVTRGRRCLHPDNCATLCCGRGYTTIVVRVVEKCRCRWLDGRCCQVVCDNCQRNENRYFCK